MDKREFLRLSLAGGVATAVAGCAASDLTPALDKPALSAITGDVEPISVQERQARVRKAQTLMQANNIDAVLIEPGAAMTYFSGVRWWRSERLVALVIPREGDIAFVAPYFEEPSIRESMQFGDDVRTWHEHENPFERVAGVLADRGLNAPVVGLEDTVRHFIADGLQRAGVSTLVSAQPVTLGCRMFKTASELRLMRKANEITLRAYEHVLSHLETGMAPGDVRALMISAQTELGGSSPWGLALFGEASAYPHGSDQPQTLREGQIVLMDCGCAVEGYRSDISRTFVPGQANARQREVWDTVRQGQQIAFEAARPGVPAGTVDDAVRAYYESQGYGPDYATPGLSHRTGHGIGMEVHESVNFVRGEKTPLSAGMCFSDEPGIYIFGEFGIRIEDCIYMTDSGPAWFTEPPNSIDAPLGRLGPAI